MPKIDFLPYKPGALRPVASAPFKALKCFDFKKGGKGCDLILENKEK
jgi:hypothetical protein